MPPVATRKTLSATVSFFAVLVTIAFLAIYAFAGTGTLTVSGTQLGVSSQYLGANEGSSQFNINYTATATTNSSGVASFSTNATSSTGSYFLLLPYVDTSLTSYYYDSYQNRAWTTYFTVP